VIDNLIDNFATVRKRDRRTFGRRGNALIDNRGGRHRSRRRHAAAPSIIEGDTRSPVGERFA
jgi:hypothetical protein